MKNLQNFWDPIKLSSGKIILCRLGSLRLWIGRAAKEWGYAVERGDSLQLSDLNEVPVDVVPENLEWQRIAFTEAPLDFRLSPLVPDRPVVIRPSYPVRIPSKESAKFYALMPLHLELQALPEKDKVVMGRVETRVLSDTWFGDYASGILSYSLAFAAERDFENLKPYPHHVVVPIDLHNRSREDLVFEKLCLRPQYLSLFATPKRVWSSRVKITNEDNYRTSSVRYSKSGPEIDQLTLIAEPEAVPERGALQRLTFSSQFSGDLKMNTL